MRKNLKFTMLAAGVIAGGLLSSCSQNEPAEGLKSDMLLRAPKMLAYSGNHTWTPGVGAGTRVADTNANMWSDRWDCPPRPAEDLTPEELAELKELLSKGKPTDNEIVLPFENYYVQQIFKGTDTYNTHDRCLDVNCDHVNGQTELGSGHMDKLLAYSGAWETVDYDHISNFNSGDNTNHPGNCGCGVSHFGTTLMTGMPTEGLDPNTQFGFHESWGTEHDYNNYFIVEYKGYYYVGFDYEAHKPDQGTHNHGEGMDIERDWNFTDWIVRITPAYPKGETPEGNPGGIIGGTHDDDVEVPSEDEVCEECGHAHEEGTVCDECVSEGKSGTSCTTSGNTGGIEKPGDGDDDNDNDGDIRDTVKKGLNEVEVNNHAEKKEDGTFDSHLSIHVRHATDVEIFIPVPQQYYCEADDLLIAQIHDPNHSVHDGPYQATYVLEDKEDGPFTVTLNVEYRPDGIRIWTDGITQEVIDFCYKHYQDGLNFEVWTYFNEELDFETLKDYLSQATIKFLDDEPDSYINAFEEENGASNPDDCEVRIVDEQSEDYDVPRQGEHLNGSHYNVIYDKKDGTPEPPQKPQPPVY